MAVAHGRGPTLEFEKPFASSFDLDSFFASRFNAELTEASNSSLCATPVTGRKRIIKRPLSLASPHQSINVIRSQVIFDQTQPEIPHVRISQARGCGRLPVHVDLHCLIKTRHVAPKYILEPADHFHVATTRGRQHVGNDV